MIESLTVTNFYCFKERTTILFTAKKERNRMLDNNFCGFTTQNKINILKLVFLLGNNGAGKSKILSALMHYSILLPKFVNVKMNLYVIGHLLLTKNV